MDEISQPVSTATHPEAAALYCGPMLKLDLIKFDPFAYILIVAVVVLQLYSTFLRPSGPDVDAILRRSDDAYQTAVFDTLITRAFSSRSSDRTRSIGSSSRPRSQRAAVSDAPVLHLS